MNEKKLHEIVRERGLLESKLKKTIEEFNQERSDFIRKIDELKRLEDCGKNNLDVEKIQKAEKILNVGGNPYGKTSEVTDFGYKTIAEQAIVDIANGCKHLKTEYFGNKQYSGFYQQSCHSYGYSPKHGSICDKISLLVKDRELTDDEKDVCIYYLKNYKRIKGE